MPQYDPKKIEPKWQKKWREERVYEPDLDAAKRADGSVTRPFYNLMMFPYPSAEGLHVGNMYAFTGADIYGRMKRMQGNDVFEPIGLDGFGIHSENYALKIGTHPMDQAAASEKRFYAQLEKIGNGFAWDEHLETYDPEYYRWTQWIFAEMFRRGLAYRKKQSVNWCPKDQTVLADEQVEGGKCERCGAEVIKKELEQWFFKITDYAERLLSNLDALDWSEKVKVAQKNWIGRSEGAIIKFSIFNFPFSVEVFTTRPDTLFGANYLVLSPEHELISKLKNQITNAAEVEAYVEAARKKKESERTEEKEKTGVELKGVKAINPASGEEIPIWIGDYVLATYGTGAIMAVPAHDERDFAFAKKYNLPIKIVIEPETGKILPDEQTRKSIVAVVEDPKTGKFLTLNWGSKLGGTLFIGGGREEGEDEVATALREIQEETGYTNLKFISKTERTHHHYFAFSKNVARNIEVIGLYFQLAGDEKTAIKLKDNEKGKFEIEWLAKDQVFTKMEDENHLLTFRRLVLGEIYAGHGLLTGSGKFDGMASEKAKAEIAKAVGGEMKTTFRLRDWLISRQRYWGPPIPMIFCEACAAAKKGERADMPGWYAVADADLPVILPHIENFRPTGSGVSPLAAEKSFYEVPCPQCGAPARRETDVSDTFLDSAWYYLGYLSTGKWKMENGKKENALPFDQARAKKWLPAEMYTGGAEHAVLHLLYVRFMAMVFHDWRGADGQPLVEFEEPFKKFRAHGLIIKDGAKMSKSKGNVINPDEYIANFGADTLRMYLMFLAPFEQGGDFRDSGVLGTERFLKRVWKLAGDMENGKGGQAQSEAKTLLHKTIKKITEDIDRLHYNTAVSALMILLNGFEEHGATREDFEIFLKLLAPFAPHITEEIWRETLGHTTTIHREPWPEFDPKLIESETILLVFQVNGKVRDTIMIDAAVTEAQAKEAALANEKVQKAMAGTEPKKIIYIEKRLVNIVTSNS